ncbi:MAG: hypothetical protein Kow0090_04360 [Myxococcota bacterium]
MLALKVQQKETAFYLVSYPAGDLLRNIRFEKRIVRLSQNEKSVSKKRLPDDVEKFISSVIESELGFQRELKTKKIQEICSFIELSIDQPPIPSTVLLYTSEELIFNPQGGTSMGNLTEPSDKFTIIDGQHRLAGLKLYIDKHPEDGDNIYVPVAIFDRKTAEFAAEMFVIVNSTHSRIAKSLLVDLLESVKIATREERVAARIVRKLYEDARSPLRFRINRLGGRSGRDKWILQAQLYNEILNLLKSDSQNERRQFVLTKLSLDKLGERPHGESQRLDEVGETVFTLFSDWFKATAEAFGETWGNDKYMVTKPATIQAITRTLGEEMVEGGLVNEYLREGMNKNIFSRALVKAWQDKDFWQDFRAKGFYERFAAKGTPERIRLIRNKLKEKLDAARQPTRIS